MYAIFKHPANVTFELAYEPGHTLRGQVKHIDKCYRNPSERKRYIYSRWAYLAQCMDADMDTFGIIGYNCMTFSVYFEFDNPYNGKRMAAWITPQHNYAYYLDC